MIRLTRRYRFSASHRLYCPALSEDANAALYGKCNNPQGHGHNYTLEVSVRGKVDSRTGRVVNVGELDRLLENAVLSRLEHRHLNVEASGLAGPIPTTENLANGIRTALLDRWTSVFPEGKPALERIRVHETRRNAFEISSES